MAAVGRLVRDYRNAILLSHKNIRWFFLASFLSQISNGFFSVLYNLYIKGLGLPDTVAGSYVSASSLASAICLVPAGILSDRIGRKRAILYAGAVSSAVLIVQSFLHSASWMVAASFVTGMFSSVIWVSVLPLLAENTEKEERFHLFSVNFGLVLIAQVLGSWVSGTLAEVFIKFGLGNILSIRYTLLTGAVLGLVALIPFSRIQEVKKPTEPRQRLSLQRTLTTLRENTHQLSLIGKFSISSALIGFGAGLVIPYLNLYFAERFDLSKAGIGLVIGLAQSVTALAIFMGPNLAKRFGPVRAVVGLQLSSIPFLLITGWGNNLWLASGAVIIRNALMNSGAPIQDSIMMALVNEKLRGFAVSSGQTMFTLGWAIMGPISMGIVHAHGAYHGYAIVFSMTAGLYLIGSLFYGLSFGRHEKQVYAAEQSSTVSS